MGKGIFMNFVRIFWHFSEVFNIFRKFSTFFECFWHIVVKSDRPLGKIYKKTLLWRVSWNFPKKISNFSRTINVSLFTTFPHHENCSCCTSSPIFTPTKRLLIIFFFLRAPFIPMQYQVKLKFVVVKLTDSLCHTKKTKNRMKNKQIREDSLICSMLSSTRRFQNSVDF